MRLIDADELRREFIVGHDLVGAKYVDLAPTIEPNLVINPDEVERGGVVEIGENIVVMHHDDYYDMFLKSELYDDIKLCEDAISREVAIEQIVNTPTLNQEKGQDYLDGSATRQNEIIDILKSLPSVAPSRLSGEWIPCSERLPEENGQSYLTYQGSAKYGFCQVLYYDDGWNCYHGDKENEIEGVVAWMPLPEPYKESE